MMKKNTKMVLLAFGALLGGLSLSAQTARLQVIHNCADAAAASVDVWINDSLLIDDFAFRTATEFIDAPAGVPFDITICGSGSTDTTNEVKRFSGLNLMAGSTYVAVANGIVSATGYSPAPAFDLDLYALGRETASNSANTDLLVCHGSTDAPAVDVVGVGAGTLVDSIVYGAFSNYLELPTADYSIQIRNEAGTDVVAEFSAPLQTLTLDGAAAVVVASGFLDTTSNSNGPAFGLWVALPSGGNLVQLPSKSISTARAQLIHNCADAAAAIVDVWVNDSLYADNFAFRKASPWIDIPAGVAFDITICGSSSTDTTNEVIRFNYPATAIQGGMKYVIIASGIVSATGYSPLKPFSLEIFGMGRETATLSTNTDVLVYHGSTDAPKVDVENAANGNTLVDDAAYTNFAGYLSLPTANYTLNVTDSTGNTIVKTYAAPLQSLVLGGEALTILASGFLDSTQNSNGPGFGLWVALAAGGDLVPLSEVSALPARVQVIHNCADAAAALVDVWLNDSLLLNDFAFRTATPWVNVPAGVPFDITICGPTSTDTTSDVFRQTFPGLLNGGRYIIVASGIVSTTGYSPIKPFSLEVFGSGRETATVSTNTDILVYHGSTDAPKVDVEEAFSGNTLVDDATYTDFAGYLSLPTSNYSISVTDSNGVAVVASYAAPLQSLGLGGQAITILASGFLTPGNNSSGPAFGLWVALPAGGPLVQLAVVTSVEEQSAGIAYTLYPNPAVDQTTIAYTLVESAQQVVLTVTDMSGRMISTIDLGSQSAGSYQQVVELSNLSEGVYITEMLIDGKVSRQRFVVNR
jgi:hypothetical protein